LTIFTNTAAKRDLFNTTFWHQDVLSVKIVASSCPASSQSRQAVLLRIFWPYFISPC